MAVIDIKDLPISPNRDLKTVIGFDAQNELIKATYTNNGGGIVDLSNYYTKEEINDNYYDKNVIEDYVEDYREDYRYLENKINNISTTSANNIVIGITNNITNREWLEFINGNRNVFYYKRDEYNGYTKTEYLYTLTRSEYHSVYSSTPHILVLEFDCTDRTDDDNIYTITKTYIATLTINDSQLDAVPTITITSKEDRRLYDIWIHIAENTSRIIELETKVQELENKVN